MSLGLGLLLASLAPAQQPPPPLPFPSPYSAGAGTPIRIVEPLRYPSDPAHSRARQAPPLHVQPLIPVPPAREAIEPTYPVSTEGGQPLPQDRPPRGQYDPGLQRVQAPALSNDEEERRTQVQIQLEPPGPERIFGRLESEGMLLERMRQEARDLNLKNRLTFPPEPVLSQETYRGRNWPTQHLCVEPAYVCYNRLLFEQKNFERQGWDLGPVTSLVSPLVFYKDVVLLPYHLAEDPHRRYECNAGYCLPGDPTPLLLYPPGLSVSGTAVEVGVIAALFAIFP